MAFTLGPSKSDVGCRKQESEAIERDDIARILTSGTGFAVRSSAISSIPSSIGNVVSGTSCIRSGGIMGLLVTLLGATVSVLESLSGDVKPLRVGCGEGADVNADEDEALSSFIGGASSGSLASTFFENGRHTGTSEAL